MTAPNDSLRNAAAGYLITAHRMRIRFMHLLSLITDPEIATPLNGFYSPERLDAIFSQAVKLYAEFRVAGERFSSLDGLGDERAWRKVYRDGKGRFDEAVGMLRVFEAEWENRAVEWQAVGMRPKVEVEVGGLYPGIEDLDLPLEVMDGARKWMFASA
jgi:hypothetical protein